MGGLIASKDWSCTPLGPLAKWPASLRTTVSLCLASNFPINIIWGPEHCQIYNDGYRVVCGNAHPRALGESYRVTWASAWPAIGEPFEHALSGNTRFLENQRMFLERNGYPEETFFTFSVSPIRDASGNVVGLFHPVTETTAAMLSQRRTRLLRDIAECAGAARGFAEAAQSVLGCIGADAFDVPMALLYAMRPGTQKATFVAGTDAHLGRVVAAPTLDGSTWPMHEAHVTDVIERFGEHPSGDYPEALREAYVLPLHSPGQPLPTGFIVLGMSPRLPVNDDYVGFFKMLAVTVGTALSNARAYEEERQRADALTQLDRAKTDFFSNVSHEFRTPLTLMLGPLEDLLNQGHGALPAAVQPVVEVVHRNALRLLKLVNALLDFSRIEANRAEAVFEPTDLGTLTTDLASCFRAAIERVGVGLDIDIEPVGQPVYVDREMWEKVVLNLISNAFKFTLQGRIRVTLRRLDDAVEMAVEDTGTGIPPDELPRIFNRFHRVHGAQGRTHEGTGIGLALVQELVKLHGGSTVVQSSLGQGSTFRVRVPLGHAHLPAQRVRTAQTMRAQNARGQEFVAEAMRWDTEGPQTSVNTAGRATILIADDNADMRDYLSKLLLPRYEVVAVCNGQAALDAARTHRPSLVLSDIMMPVMDGIAMLAAMRGDPELHTLPVILLSARAGNEAKANGIEMGADDYVTKPFSAKELLARIQMQLHMQTMRQVSIEQKTREAELEQLLQARDDFLAIMSHELKTPITSLNMQLQMGRRKLQPGATGLPTAEKLGRTFDVAIRQVHRLSMLVEELLDMSLLQAGKMDYAQQPLQLADLVRSAIERVADQFQDAHCVLESSLNLDLPVHGDARRIEQALVNLLANALKYGAGKPVRVSVREAGKWAQVRVEDQGIGIAPDKHKAIFERFERAISHTSISGLGLGLYIAHEIVAAHGGHIAVQSCLGQGSTFTIELPQHTDAASQAH